MSDAHGGGDRGNDGPQRATGRGAFGDGLHVCQTSAREPDDVGEYDLISIMVDSGASETVASADHFPDSPLVQTMASGTSYSSAAANAAEEITNVGEKYILKWSSLSASSRWQDFRCAADEAEIMFWPLSAACSRAGTASCSRRPSTGPTLATIRERT